MAVILKCPHCEEKFRWQFNAANQWPKHCPSCGGYVGTDRDDDDIVMPSIRSARMATTDKVYRDIEAGSEQRVHAAAAMAGCDASEMSSLKITNLNDRRDAEIAAMPLNNSVTQMMARPGVEKSFGFQANGAMLSPDVMSGPNPNAGTKMRTFVQSCHQEMVAQHCVGVDMTTGRAVLPSTDVVSERPGNETLQPGYRRRG